MKKTIFIFFLLLTTVLCASEKPKASFAYDVDFEMRFDNREFIRTFFTPSMTIFGARLTPAVGLMLAESNGAEHKLMAGVDVMKDFGTNQENAGLFRELTLYYNLKRQIGKTGVEIYAGIFPRRKMEGAYSEVFFSDSLKFYDNNLEGLLLKFHRPKAYFEVGCDWMGKYGAEIREKFMIFTAGEGRILPFMSLGYAGYMLHYANSGRSKGLVDNILLNPYAEFDLTPWADMQKLSFRIGYLQAIQRDRVKVGAFIGPFAGEFDQEVRNWNVGVRNRMFYGYDMMPYYDVRDNAGLKYGSSLYFGDPLYRVRDDGWATPGFYDRLEVYWQPYIAEYLSMKISAIFHFHGMGYTGSQQMITLGFDLHELINRKR